MNNVILHGALAERFGARHRYHVETPHEAIRALTANKPGFADAICDMELRLIRSKPGVEQGLDLGEDDLQMGMSQSELHIIPVPAGSKNGGVGKIILGVALIAAVIVTGGGAAGFAAGLAKAGIVGGLQGALAAGASASFLGISGGTVMLAGAALALGGAAMMLAPSPKTEGSNQKSSFLVGAVGNATEQGMPVPLVYGLVLTGSVVIGLGVSTEQIGVTVGNAHSGGVSFGNRFGDDLMNGVPGGTYADISWKMEQTNRQLIATTEFNWAFAD